MSNKKLNQIFSVVKTLMAVLIAMVVAFGIILVVSKEPLSALRHFLFGPFTSVRRIGTLIENTIPLIFVGLGVCVLWATGKRTLSGEGSSAWRRRDGARQPGRGAAFLPAVRLCGRGCERAAN